MSEHAAYSPLPVVLVVENDIFERIFKAATLRRQGFEVFEAADVAEAVTVLKKIAVDLLISDISLINGAVLAQLAKEHQPTTRIAWTLESRQKHRWDCCIALIWLPKVRGRDRWAPAHDDVRGLIRRQDICPPSPTAA